MSEMQWQYRDGGGICLLRKEGKHTWEAYVVQGGNDLWTAVFSQYEERLTKRGKNSRNPACLVCELMRPQTKTEAEAKKWCEDKWNTWFMPPTPQD